MCFLPKMSSQQSQRALLKAESKGETRFKQSLRGGSRIAWVLPLVAALTCCYSELWDGLALLAIGGSSGHLDGRHSASPLHISYNCYSSKQRLVSKCGSTNIYIYVSGD